MRTLVAMAVVAATGVVVHLSPRTAGVHTAARSPTERPEVNIDAPRGVRVVRHAGGTTEAPLQPTRICALGFADELLCLGVTPVAVETGPGGEPADYLAARLRTAAPIRRGLGAGLPDFAAIAAVAPDLIVTSATQQSTIEQLSLLAPTVVLRDAATTYRENGSLAALVVRLRDLAAVVGREDAADAFVADFERTIAAARERVAAVASGTRFAFFRTHGREWRLYGRRGAFGGEAMLDALGLQSPRGVTEDGTTQLDPERLVAFDADCALVVADPSPGAMQSLARVLRHPLWLRVTAARTGRVATITVHRHWVLSGLLGKLRMCDDILRVVAP